jgi:hypothetical protein
VVKRAIGFWQAIGDELSPHKRAYRHPGTIERIAVSVDAVAGSNTPEDPREFPVCITLPPIASQKINRRIGRAR